MQQSEQKQESEILFTLWAFVRTFVCACVRLHVHGITTTHKALF